MKCTTEKQIYCQQILKYLKKWMVEIVMVKSTEQWPKAKIQSMTDNLEKDCKNVKKKRLSLAKEYFHDISTTKNTKKEGNEKYFLKVENQKSRR